jgi:hypothetical protein
VVVACWSDDATAVTETCQPPNGMAVGAANLPPSWLGEANNLPVATPTNENQCTVVIDGVETQLSALDGVDLVASKRSTLPEMWPATGDYSVHMFPNLISGEVQTAIADSSNRSEQDDDQTSRGSDLKQFPNSNVELTISDLKFANRSTAIIEMAEGTEFEVIEGSRFNRNIAEFTKLTSASGLAQYIASIDWGDDTHSDGSIVDDGNQFRVAGSHIYDTPGVYKVTARIRGPLELERSANTQIIVRDASLHATGRFIRTVAGREFRCVLAHFRDRNPFSKIEDFSARIRWGDGGLSPGEIIANMDGGFDVHGTHQFQTSGEFSAELSVVSRGGSTTNAVTSIRVEAAQMAFSGLSQQSR